MRGDALSEAGDDGCYQVVITARDLFMAMRIVCSLDEMSTLSPDEAKSILNADREGDYVLLDVRQPEEYEAGHIPGAKLIPLGELEQRQTELDKAKKIITYCRSGKRSLGASVLLCGLGFKEVYSMEEGILGWHYETITGPPQEGMELLDGVAELRDILLLAFRLEKGSWNFYSKAGEKLQEKTGTLSRLMNMEEEHMLWIYTEMTRYWTDDTPTLEELKQEPSGEYTEAGISINEALSRFERYYKEGLDMFDEDFEEDLEIIETALEVECKAYDLYKRIRDTVEDPGMRELFQRLAAAERDHIQQLSGELKHFV